MAICAQRAAELARIVDEGGDGADGGQTVQGHEAAHTDHDRQADVVDHVHHRPHEAGKDLGLGGGLAQLLVGAIKLGDDRLLLRVGLDHTLTGDRSLRSGR